MKTFFKILTLFSLLLLSSCSQDEQASGQKTFSGTGKINLVATTGMVADIAQKIGGDLVTVVGLMGPGIDPHLYKASEGDVSRMVGADMIFYSGFHLEGKMAEIFEKMNRNKPTVAVAENIAAEHLIHPEYYEGNPDPHVWFDVSLWQEAVKRTAEALIEFDPGRAETYRANLKTYLSELEELHQYVLSQAEKVPADKRVLVTAHDAFNYFGQAYGFEVRGLQGISTAAETGTADVQALADFIFERKIPAIFVESSVPTRYIEALQAAVKARGFDVEIGGNLFSDAMGTPGTPEGTYLGMVRYNIDTIVTSLLTRNPS